MQYCFKSYVSKYGLLKIQPNVVSLDSDRESKQNCTTWDFHVKK